MKKKFTRDKLIEIMDRRMNFLTIIFWAFFVLLLIGIGFSADNSEEIIIALIIIFALAILISLIFMDDILAAIILKRLSIEEIELNSMQLKYWRNELAIRTCNPYQADNRFPGEELICDPNFSDMFYVYTEFIRKRNTEENFNVKNSIETIEEILYYRKRKHEKDFRKFYKDYRKSFLLRGLPDYVEY